MQISIIPVAHDLGAEELGAYDGPSAISATGLVDKLQSTGLDVAPAEEIAATKRADLEITDTSLPYVDEIVRICGLLAQSVYAAISSGSKPVVIGGDHSINLGTFTGASIATSGPVGMIYIDAHGDMNTPEASASHNIHGMHLASLMGRGPSDMVDLGAPGAKLDPSNLLHIAASDLDEFESKLIDELGIESHDIDSILMSGMAPVIAAIDDLSNRVDSIWISLDLDAINVEHAPGVGIRNHGGLTYREIELICRCIGQQPNIIGMDVVEYNPNHDIDNKTAELAIELIAKMLGKNYSWYSNYMARQGS